MYDEASCLLKLLSLLTDTRTLYLVQSEAHLEPSRLAEAWNQFGCMKLYLLCSWNRLQSQDGFESELEADTCTST